MTGVSLRPIALDDWRRVHEWASTEAACRHQPWGPNDEADTRQFVVDALGAWTSTASTRRVWAAQTQTHGVIGLGELKIRSLTHRQAEISYAVHTDLWGQGYGEAIARSLVEVGRAEGMHRIAGTCDPRNGASARVLQKIGMSYEGRMRHTLHLRDGWRDTDVYALVIDT